MTSRCPLNGSVVIDACSCHDLCWRHFTEALCRAEQVNEDEEDRTDASIKTKKEAEIK
jgi:hypothetical protein